MRDCCVAPSLSHRPGVRRPAGRSLLAGVLAAGALTLPGDLVGQTTEPSSPPPEGRLCFWPAPAPGCRTWVIIEAQGVLPVMESSNIIFSPPNGAPPQELELYLDDRNVEVNLGLMVNLSPDWSVGGFWTGGSGSGGSTDGLRGRVRWWSGGPVRLELEGGTITSNLGSRAPPRTGPTVGVRASLWDVGTLTVRYDRVEIPPETYRTGGTVSGVSVGAGFAGKAGLAAGTLGLVGILALSLALAGIAL